MSRTKTYNTKEVIGYLNEYRIENPGLKISIPKFGTYLRGKGCDVQDHTLRRDEEFKKYLEEINKEESSERFNELITYKTIDVDAFIEKNNNKVKLKEAIINRDRYYADIAARATEAIHEKNECLEKLRKSDAETAKLKEQIKKLEEKQGVAIADDSELKKKDEIITALKSIIDDYIYPNAANAILRKEGILKIENNIIDDETIDKQMMNANTSIDEGETEGADKEKKTSKYASVNSLLGGFDD